MGTAEMINMCQRFALLCLLALFVTGCYESRLRSSSEPVATGGTGSSNRLAIDESALYWLDLERGTVMTQSREAEAATTLASASAINLRLVINETDLFWVARGTVVERVPLGGGEVERVAEGDAGPLGIAVDATSLYFTRLHSSGVVGGSPAPKLYEVSLETGRERVVADSRPAIGMAIDDAEIFATSCGPDGVWHVSRSGGELVTLVEVTFCAFGVALDDQNIYFPDRVVHEDRSTQLGVFRTPRSGGTPELVTHTV